MSESISSPRRRRWLTFSLRFLLAITTLLAIGLAWVAKERRQSWRELVIAQQLMQSGVDVEFVGVFDAPLETPYVMKSSFTIQRPESQSWWRAVLNRLWGPRVFSIVGNNVKSLNDISSFAELKSLQSVWLNNTQVQDLSPLAELEDLEEISFSGAQVKELAPLAGLQSLRRLYAARTSVRDLAPLSRLNRLGGLYLYETPVSDLSPLADCSNLKRLDIRKTQVTDIRSISGLRGLQTLDVGETQITGQQLEEFLMAVPNCEVMR